MVPSFLLESQTSKKAGVSSFEKFLSAVRPSLPGDLLFVSEFIDFIILSKDISALKRLCVKNFA